MDNLQIVGMAMLIGDGQQDEATLLDRYDMEAWGPAAALYRLVSWLAGLFRPRRRGAASPEVGALTLWRRPEAT